MMALAGAAGAVAAAGAVGAGVCATAESVSSSTGVASIRRCKTRGTDFVSFLQETDRRTGDPSPDP